VELLEKVKRNIRISSTALDDAEITPLIAAALKDLETAGVTKLDDADPLIERAIVTYCKAHFGYDNADSEKLKAAYDSIKHALTQLAEYTDGGAGDG
jgi:uncharacterized phage protein (predicted DNA packaging)